MSDSEEAHIAACLAGDPRSWEALVRRYEREVTRQMRRFSRDPRVCEELAQDVFVQVYLALPRYRSRGTPFEHWLRRIATRVGYGFWKRQAAQRSDDAAPVVRLTAQGPVQRMQAADAARLLHELLARLETKDRLVLTLTYLEECDTREAARRTGWNRAAVKMRLMRARRKLRKLVEAAGLHEMDDGSTDHG